MTQYVRQYESIIIVNSSLHEDTLNRIIQRCEEIITKNGGKIVETERWGKRRLAYPINKFQYGFYIIFHIEAPSSMIVELEREFRLNENILRFLTLVKDKRAIAAYTKRKEREAAGIETTSALDEVQGKNKRRNEQGKESVKSSPKKDDAGTKKPESEAAPEAASGESDSSGEESDSAVTPAQTDETAEPKPADTNAVSDEKTVEDDSTKSPE